MNTLEVTTHIQVGDKTGCDLHDGFPVVMYDGHEISQRSIRLPVSLVSPMMPHGYLNKMVYCVAVDHHKGIVVFAGIYDGTAAFLITVEI